VCACRFHVHGGVRAVLNLLWIILL
jgi:hypothetical protein